MDFFTLLTLCAVGLYGLNLRERRSRIALLGAYLGQFRIEKLMADLMQGYMRALAEPDAQRQAAIWNVLTGTESDLCEQFNTFVLAFAKVNEAQARVSTLGWGFPYASLWFPMLTFDSRKVLSLHAHALTQAARNSRQLPAKAKAFTLMAELMLMQHSCHWFCRSKSMASARLLARHQTAYAQVLQAIDPDTRRAYLALVDKA